MILLTFGVDPSTAVAASGQEGGTQVRLKAAKKETVRKDLETAWRNMTTRK